MKSDDRRKSQQNEKEDGSGTKGAKKASLLTPTLGKEYGTSG